MARREEVEREFMRLVPEFKDAWDEYRREWGEETPGICTDFAEFSRFIHDAMRRHQSLDLPGVFTFIEILPDAEEGISYGLPAFCDPARLPAMPRPLQLDAVDLAALGSGSGL